MTKTKNHRIFAVVAKCHCEGRALETNCTCLQEPLPDTFTLDRHIVRMLVKYYQHELMREYYKLSFCEQFRQFRPDFVRNAGQIVESVGPILSVEEFESATVEALAEFANEIGEAAWDLYTGGLLKAVRDASGVITSFESRSAPGEKLARVRLLDVWFGFGRAHNAAN